MRYLSAAFCITLILIISGCAASSEDINEKNSMLSEDQNVSENINNSSQPIDLSRTTNQIDIGEMNFNGVKFGDTRQDVKNKLGEPDGIEELYGAYCYKDFTINFTEEDKVCKITVTNKDFSCYKDINKGDDILITLKELPVPTTPAGIELLYKKFNGDNAHDLNLLDEFSTLNTKDSQMPDEPNYFVRVINYSFDNYILTISYTSKKAAENSNSEFKAGEIDGIWVQTADAPLFED